MPNSLFNRDSLKVIVLTEGFFRVSINHAFYHFAAGNLDYQLCRPLRCAINVFYIHYTLKPIGRLRRKANFREVVRTLTGLK